MSLVWITYLQAAEILEVGNTTVQRLIERGELQTRRPVSDGEHHKRGRPPSLDYGEVVALAERRAYAVELAEAERAAARGRLGPPDNDHVWLSTKIAAAMLRVTPIRAAQLAKRERVPAVMHGGRWWFRRDQIEMVAGARAAKR